MCKMCWTFLKYTNVKFVKKAGYYSVIGLTKILATGPDNQMARYFQNTLTPSSSSPKH